MACTKADKTSSTAEADPTRKSPLRRKQKNAARNGSQLGFEAEIFKAADTCHACLS